MKLGSLFSGLGGFELAAWACGHEVIWQSDNDPWCTRLLAQRFPGVPNHGDITAIDWSTVERPDIMCGGFPCQDISISGEGAGLEGARSGLWYAFADGIRALRPRYVIVENVDALLRRGFDAVLGSLAELGYDAEWSVYGAADVGAPHRRRRTWILATLPGAPRGREGLRHAGRGRLSRFDGWGTGPESSHGRALVPAAGDDGRDYFARWWAVEPPVRRVAHGVPRRVERLRALGNAIVPTCALPIFERIAELEAVA